jgi:hypothetical protein
MPAPRRVGKPLTDLRCGALDDTRPFDTLPPSQALDESNNECRGDGGEQAHDLPPAIDVALVQAGFKDHGGRPESRPGRFSEGFARRWSPKPWSRKPFGPS